MELNRSREGIEQVGFWATARIRHEMFLACHSSWRVHGSVVLGYLGQTQATDFSDLSCPIAKLIL